jgi:transcriptional regulator with XRE-family HTH domain
VIEKGLFNVLVGRNLRRLRRSSDLTLDQLGGALGVSLQQLHKHEQGRGVSLWRAVQICRALDVPLSELVPVARRRSFGHAAIEDEARQHTAPASAEKRIHEPSRDGGAVRDGARPQQQAVSRRARHAG